MNKLHLNKLHVLAALTVCVFGSVTVLAFKAQRTEAKQQQIEKLFGLVMDRKQITDACEPIFANMNIADEDFKQEAYDKLFSTFKQEFATFFDKEFSDEHIDAVVAFFSSEAGRHYVATSLEQGAAMQKAFQGLMIMIQERMMAEQKDVAVADSHSSVINFAEIVNGKADAETKELFNDIIQHEGITVVKFSAIWCGPCQIYAPTFDEVAGEFQELTLGDQKLAIKYVAVDIDAAMPIAQEYAVRSVPTTLFFKNGQKIDGKVGGMQKVTLRSHIQELAQ